MPSRVVFTASDGFVLMSQTNLKYFIAFQFLTANGMQIATLTSCLSARYPHLHLIEN